MADNIMRGQNPKRKFYIPAMVDNSDGTLGEVVVSLERSYRDNEDFKSVLNAAQADVKEHSGEVYVYELIPVARVTEENKHWPLDDFRWAAQRALLKPK